MTWALPQPMLTVAVDSPALPGATPPRVPLARRAAAELVGTAAAAYWFTSSTSFANPAVTIGRTFTDTFASLAPGSVARFIAAQLLGAVVGLAAVASSSRCRRRPPLRRSQAPVRTSTPVVAAQAAMVSW